MHTTRSRPLSVPALGVQAQSDTASATAAASAVKRFMLPTSLPIINHIEVSYRDALRCGMLRRLSGEKNGDTV